MPFMDITIGTKLHRLEVIAVAEPDGYHKRWLCKCECGNEKIIRHHDLARGQQSCGCLRKESAAQTGKKARKHGMSRIKSKEYQTWASMKNRVQVSSSYPAYRGVPIQKEWVESFETFYADVGPCPEHEGKYKWSIDRINPELGYVRGNVRWADYKTQIDNRAATHMVTMNGKTQSVLDWCRKLGLSPPTIYGRINRKGMDPAEALQMPVKPLPRLPHVTFNGRTQSVRDWARELGIDAKTLSRRIKKMTPEQAMTTKPTTRRVRR